MSWPDVFFSLRYAEAKEEALQIKEALEKVGISSYICQTLAGNNIVDEIVDHLEHAKLAVIMGGETYGAQGTTKFTTKQELTSIVNEDKPFVLVKMCDEFAEFKTRFKLPDDIAHVKWPKGASMPANLVDKIQKKLAAVEAGGGDAPALPRKARENFGSNTSAGKPPQHARARAHTHTPTHTPPPPPATTTTLPAIAHGVLCAPASCVRWTSLELTHRHPGFAHTLRPCVTKALHRQQNQIKR